MMQVDTTGDAKNRVVTMTPDEAKAELAKREADKMTRRAALSKIGLRTGMAIFAAFSIDDLARKTATLLTQRSQDNAVVEKVARDLHNAGVAFADEVCYDPDGNVVDCGTKSPCEQCVDTKLGCLTRATNAALECRNTTDSNGNYVHSQAYCD